MEYATKEQVIEVITKLEKSIRNSGTQKAYCGPYEHGKFLLTDNHTQVLKGLGYAFIIQSVNENQYQLIFTYHFEFDVRNWLPNL